ncbi:MAG: NAD(P)/FAD-dependent oxidoreductase [Lachnospiraceae bacterium]|nr:NAD(P)/FAD-dependent oxidoreductase [Lachnospiraceae bacterium]
MSKVIVIGGGAAGCMAAITAARNGHNVVLVEKNEKIGKKLYITGKGRCNITNACATEDLFTFITSNPKFLYSAYNEFSNWDTIGFFEELGLRTKIERGERVFPESDKSSDVITALSKELRRLGVDILYNTTVKDVLTKEGAFSAIVTHKGDTLYADSLIVATGGLSYPSTGSTGEGYEFAKKIGHNITSLYPSLVPFNVKEAYARQMQGLSLKNIEISIFNNEKELYREFGEMLFTHFGVSGPVIISASSYIAPILRQKTLKLIIDLKPALTFEQLDARILRDFEEFKNKQFKNALDKLLPSKLISVIIERSGILPEKKVNEISKVQRENLVKLIKGFELTLTGLRDYNEAIITKGGIDVKQINPKTMESKLTKNIYFAGEVLDLDALTGGHNLQIAWATGYVAGLLR